MLCSLNCIFPFWNLFHFLLVLLKNILINFCFIQAFVSKVTHFHLTLFSLQNSWYDNSGGENTVFTVLSQCFICHALENPILWNILIQFSLRSKDCKVKYLKVGALSFLHLILPSESSVRGEDCVFHHMLFYHKHGNVLRGIPQHDGEIEHQVYSHRIEW